MRLMKKMLYTVMAAMTLFAVAACGGGSGSSGDSTQSSGTNDSTQSSGGSLSGVVIDGYWQGAEVFMDFNGNFEHDENEPLVSTDAYGQYRFENLDNDSFGHPVVAKGTAGVTYDDGLGQYLTDNITMVSLDNDSMRVVSPFTSLHWYYMNNDNMTFEEARNKVIEEFGLPSHQAVFEDFVEKSYDNTSYQNMVNTSLRMGEYMGYYFSSDNSTTNMREEMMNGFTYMHQNVGWDNFTDDSFTPGMGMMRDNYPINGMPRMGMRN